MIRHVRQVFALVCVLLAACGTTRQASLAISAGDDKAKVIATLGAPDDRQFRERQEAWQYGSVASIGVCEYTIIWFENAKVSGVNSYRNMSSMGCSAGIRSVRWEEAPNTVIEIRQR